MAIKRTVKIRLPKRGEGSIRNPFAAYFNAMTKIGIEPEIAKHYAKLAAKVGCDLTTMINDVLEKEMTNEKAKKVTKTPKSTD